ncbi:MAG: hypothetical protein EDM79_17260 [Chloroflexi bacterium]|nr:MAG: hypothetical protein EDM79_17260 [Chloroflexota bacterium]
MFDLGFQAGSGFIGIAMHFAEYIGVGEEGAQAGLGTQQDLFSSMLRGRKVLWIGIAEDVSA